jgi:hypothetical protein
MANIKTKDKLRSIQETIAELQDYLPLTVRQIYYQVVSKGVIPNSSSYYVSISRALTKARGEGLVSWNAIDDRSRRFIDLSGYTNTKKFLDITLSQWLGLYNRDLLQTQDKYIEIWTEKDALSTLFEKVASRYTIPVAVNRGFASTTFMNNYRNRIRHHIGKKFIILYFGDMDPSGMYMTFDIEKRLYRLGMDNVEVKRITLNPGDNDRYNLLDNPNSFASKNPNTPWFIENYGQVGYELDALPPQILQEKTKTSIENELDMDKFNIQVALSKNDTKELEELKKKILESINQ